jgi:S1-C subfamily serine protease
VYDKYGHMITNNHVVENTSSVTVTFIDDNQYDAVVIGKDIVNDIAVLKLPGNITETIIPVEFGNSSAVRIGERIFTLTGGFISQVGRLILESGTIAPFPHSNMIQTDALINPGNLRGPLVNLQGHLIGMTTANIDSPHGGTTGLGFAIPSKTLIREIPVLIENGTYSNPWLGISALNLNPEINKKAGLVSTFNGVLVDSVVKDGPAFAAGIEGSDQLPNGDIITALDGISIRNVHDFLSYIENNKKTGDKIVISVYKNKVIASLSATLGERPLSVYTSTYLSSQTPLF